jgi:hypothetical protein
MKILNQMEKYNGQNSLIIRRRNRWRNSCRAGVLTTRFGNPIRHRFSEIRERLIWTPPKKASRTTASESSEARVADPDPSIIVIHPVLGEVTQRACFDHSSAETSTQHENQVP